MIDDPLEWLAVTLEDDEPTIPDALGPSWLHLGSSDEDTGLPTAIDDDPREAEWELELEAELTTRPRGRRAS